MIIQQTGHALGTDILLTLNIDNETKAKSILLQIRSFLSQFEKRFSRFLPGSELNKVNVSAGKPIEVSPEFIELAKISSDMQSEIDGSFTPFILPSLQRAGYVSSWPDVKNQSAVADYSDRKKITGQKISIEARSVRIPVDSAIDFGGIGKGFALDKIADIIEANDCDGYWVSLGGDVIGRGVGSNGNNWHIELSAISDSSSPPIYYDLPKSSRLAIATSSTLKRRGNDWHHIIDPRTGKPAKTEIESATVIAKSGVLADVIAKCLIISGDDALDFWHQHPQADGYIKYQNRYVRLES